MKTLLLIDANSLIHRAFHALPPLTAPDGRPTQSLYGISNILLRIFKDERPEYASALFDRPERTFRKEKYEAYKAQRPKAPNELVSQIIEAHTLFGKFGIRTFEKPGFEADDLIATLAVKFSGGKDLQVVILTGDLDTLQIVDGEKLVVRTFKKGISETMTYSEQAVRERYGLEPKQLTDYKAFVGDASDNIKGVPGVGEKTATSLLQKYGTLENIYKNLPAEPKLGKKLEGTKEQALFSRSLVMLKKDVPVEVAGVDDLKIIENGKNLEEYFRGLGFESLIKRLQNGKAEEIKTKEVETNTQKRNISGQAPLRTRASDGQASIFGDLPNVEMKGDKDKVFVSEDSAGKDLKSDKLKVGFELKQLLKEFWNKRADILPPYFDLGVAFWMLDSDFKDYTPEATAIKFLKRNWKGGQEDYERAYEFCRKKIKEYEMEPVFQNIEMRLMRILAEMEQTGISVNAQKLKILEEKIEKDINVLTKKIYEAAGEEFNINSSQQLGKIIFEKLGVDSRLAKKTGGGKVSTREESLLAFRSAHPIVDLVLEYRGNFKIQTTYVKPLQDLANSDGRVRTEFVQTGAGTGRLSSRNPNLQNIPQESKWSRELRSVFEASKGFSFLSFDYSQIELRVFAAVAGDDKMIDAFKNGIDVHTLTAAKILGKPLEAVTKDDRRLAKTLNFGLLYGMGVSSFAKSSGLKRDQAKAFVETYFREFSEIRDWQEATKREVRKYGFTRTLSGRRRYLPGINSLAPQVVAEAERAAINHPLQGLAADIIKMAMIKTHEELEKKGFGEEKARMLLTIHDELLFEVRDDMIKEISLEVKKAMESVFDLGVPLKVEVSSGKDWGNLVRNSG